MLRTVLLLRLVIILTVSSIFFLYRNPFKTNATPAKNITVSYNKEQDEGEGEGEESEENEDFTIERLRHEYLMLRNPITGTIPKNIREIELNVASRIPDKVASFGPLSRGNGTTINNNYQSIGPNNIAGRSRALGFDRRNPNIMLTGGTTGGLFRSTNGGATWTFVTPENDIRGATALAQDPLHPDTWYYGTGEAWYVVSYADVSNGTYGHGMFKSTDNGATWTKLKSTEGNENQFDNPFDLNYRIMVHPTTGYVYAAVHRRIMRSRDGGATWEQVLGSTTPSTSLGGITDLLIPSNGQKIFATVTGENPDRNLVGVWESSTGDAGSWKRIAGGVKGQPDSVAGWRAFSKYGRTVLALNNSNTQLYVLYKNPDSAAGANPKPEADLFRADISSGNPSTYKWTNLNSYVPDEPNFNAEGIDPYTTQFNGYDMSIAVKPDNDNILFIGGTVLERVDLSQTNAAKKFRRIGGYGKGFFPNEFIYPGHHPDVHGIYFQQGNTNTMFTVDDGGVHKTTNSVMADTVRWQPLDSNLQTLHYQTINISPDTDFTFVLGGAQDNGTPININPLSQPPKNQEAIQIGGGDGASSAVSGLVRGAAGNTTWTQNWYISTINGSVYRYDITLNSSNGQLDEKDFNEITPTGLGDKGQWLTLLVNDPDSAQHLYYNSKNKLYRTLNASKVTPSTWTELTAVGTTVPANENFTHMAISKKIGGNKYLYFGTDNGHVYRLNNPNTAPVNTVPADITPSAMVRGSFVAGIAVNPRNPDTVMVVVSNYDASGNVISNIFFSGNATTATPTWQVVDGALEPVSSQSCAIVVKNSGVEFYVGTSVGLYSTTTLNGNSTQWLHEGSGMMKTAIIRALVNRQQDNTMVVGTHGNGAFITQIGDAVTITDVVTGINNPVVNDKNFIKAVYPTLSSNIVQYYAGNMYSIKKIFVQLFNAKGQKVFESTAPYQDGSVDVSRFAGGNYILVIDSEDGKYRYIQKIIRQ